MSKKRWKAACQDIDADIANEDIPRTAIDKTLLMENFNRVEQDNKLEIMVFEGGAYCFEYHVKKTGRVYQLPALSKGFFSKAGI